MSRPREISGFTLFWNGDKREGLVPSWQMSVRRKDEDGWDVQRISEDQAQAIFAMLVNSGHPDGPWKVNTLEVWQSLDGPKLGEGISARKYNGWEETCLKMYVEMNIAARAENTEVRNGLA